MFLAALVGLSGQRVDAMRTPLADVRASTTECIGSASGPSQLTLYLGLCVRDGSFIARPLRVDVDFKTFMARRGDWAKPLLLWALRRYSGVTLSEVGEAAGGMDYTAVAMAIKRFEKRSEKDQKLRKRMQTVGATCEK